MRSKRTLRRNDRWGIVVRPFDGHQIGASFFSVKDPLRELFGLGRSGFGRGWRLVGLWHSIERPRRGHSRLRLAQRQLFGTSVQKGPSGRADFTGQ